MLQLPLITPLITVNKKLTKIGSKNNKTATKSLFTNLPWAFFRESSLSEKIACAKSIIPRTNNKIGTITLTTFKI